MTYTEVHAILEGDPETRASYPEFTADFERMRDLAMLMNQRREERGSIDFDLPEPVIQFDENGQMRGVTKSERTWANRLIEEFMLAANECVATWLEDLGVPSLYRIHEKPEPRRVVQFEELAASFGYSLGLGALPVKRIVNPRRAPRLPRPRPQIRASTKSPKTSPSRPRCIRSWPPASKASLKSASSATSCSAPCARRATPRSTRATSPSPPPPTPTSLRPFAATPTSSCTASPRPCCAMASPAMAVVEHGRHNSPWTHPNEGLAGIVLSTEESAVTSNTPLRSSPPIPEAELAQIAEETSQTERRAAEAERELVEWKKVRFMQDRVGEEFAALVLNPTKYGLFVELTELFVEGLVPIDTLRDDRYTWRENTHEIIGERWGRRFRAGDRVQVILDRILAQERRLQFSIVEEGVSLTGTKPRKTPAKPKKTRREPSPKPFAKTKKRPGRKGRRR